MKGLELSRKYYEECALPAWEKSFPRALSRAAFGLAGEGSDCFEFDDEVSQDHDWGPGFCIWLMDEDAGYEPWFKKAYAELPGAFGDLPERRETPEGAGRVGVMRVSGFYRRFTGFPKGPKTLMEWLSVPEQYLAVATNGAVFRDDRGEFSAIRRRLLGFYPEDVRRKKIAARMAEAAQAGQYNYSRCLKHGETVAAELALRNFAEAAMSLAYLLNRRYMPFYKWAHRGLSGLERLPEMSGLISRLFGRASQAEKEERIEEICGLLLEELIEQELCLPGDSFLLAHTDEVTRGICDEQIRSLPVQAG